MESNEQMNQISKDKWRVTSQVEKNPKLRELFNAFHDKVKPGPIQNEIPIKIESELDAFKLFFDEKIVDYIIQESSLYITKRYNITKESKYHYSTVANIFQKNGIHRKDIYAFVGIKLFMGVVSLPHTSHYWDTNELFNNSYVSSRMSRNFYKMLNSSIHLTQKEMNKSDENYDPRYKLGKLIDMLNKNFSKYYNCDQQISIDETMVGYKGNNTMKFYIPHKPSKWGFKFHVLAESKTGYCYRLLLDPGKKYRSLVDFKDIEGCRKSESIILSLLQGLENKGYVLYIDSWYSSPNLYYQLSQRGILCTGMIKESRLGVNEIFTRKMEYDEIAFAVNSKKGTNLNLIQWKEKRKMNLLTTMEYDNIRENNKPYPIHDYSQNMHGVDFMNYKVALFRDRRKSYKWYKYVFYHIIEIALDNAYVLFQNIKNQKMTILNFRLKVITQLLDGYKSGRSRAKTSLNQKAKMHLPIKSERRKHCKVCRNSTMLMCSACDLYLCLKCYRKFHEEWGLKPKENQ